MHTLSRTAGVAAFGALLWLAYSAPAQNEAGNWRPVADQAKVLATRLVKEYPFLLDATATETLRQAMRDFGGGSGRQMKVVSLRRLFSRDEIRQEMNESDRQFEKGARAVSEVLTRWPGLVELPENPSAGVTREIAVPHQAALVVLHRAGRPGEVPGFSWNSVRIGNRRAATVQLNERGAFFSTLELLDPPAGHNTVTITLAGAGVLRLSIAAPARFPVSIRVTDDGGKPTEAAIGIYSSRKELLIPAAAVDFTNRGYFYQDTRFRDQNGARYWPGEAGYTRCFFTGGHFEIDLPEGTYRLIAAKGPEFTPVDRTFTVSPAGKNIAQVELHRWIDMSRRGWHSGDCHIHFARPDKSANEPLRIWTQAEDLRVSNILRMGDGAWTFFEQYAFGLAGRFVGPNGIIVPGQEDPRTNIMGHTMHLNLRQAVHEEKTYYLYGDMFDETHRQGGIAGYAHVYNDLFTVRRDMALNVPLGKADFTEIAEFGSVKPELYYEFLNLGFRLTAAGGSDAPWGGTAGDARTYVYTGRPFDTEEWYKGVRAGRTFATLGPILEFTVDGHPPGDDLQPTPGQLLRIHAKVLTGKGAAPIGGLQVVANGEVIREVEAAGNTAALDFDLPSERSLWLAARTRDAHTSPVYVTVGGRRHWKVTDAARLLAARERELDEIQTLIESNGETIATHRTPDRENVDAFHRSRAGLEQRVREARRIYQGLRAELAKQ